MTDQIERITADPVDRTVTLHDETVGAFNQQIDAGDAHVADAVVLVEQPYEGTDRAGAGDDCPLALPSSSAAPLKSRAGAGA